MVALASSLCRAVRSGKRHGAPCAAAAGRGDDILVSRGTNDVVLVGNGNDFIVSTGGNYGVVRGGTGNDTIHGGNNSRSFDVLVGDEGDDTIYGHAGTDLFFAVPTATRSMAAVARHEP